MRATGMGGATTTANGMIRNVADRILNNAVNVGSYSGMDTATGARPNCPLIDPAPVCEQDFTNWQAAITALPQGTLQVTTVPNGNLNTVTVTVTWRDAMGAHTTTLPIQVAS